MAEYGKQLSREELLAFWDRHPLAEFPYIPMEGKYIADPELGGYVLIYKKPDNTKLYILVKNDPSANDPSKIGYILNETLKAVKRNTTDVVVNPIESVGEGLGDLGKLISDLVEKAGKWLVPLLLLFLFAVFYGPAKDILKAVGKK